MSEFFSSLPPGRYRFSLTIFPPIDPSSTSDLGTGTKDVLPDGASQAILSDRGQGTTSQGGSLARKRYQNGSVFLRGKNQMWIGRYREDLIRHDGTVQRKRTSVVLGSKKEFPTKRLAERRMNQVLSHINASEYRPGRVGTLAEFSERWKPEILSKQKPSAGRSAASHLQHHIIPQLGKLRLDQLGVENQQTFVTRISQGGVSRKTVLNILGTLSSMFRTAKNWGYICEAIDLRKLALPERGITQDARFFTVDEIRKILAAADDPWRSMFTVLAMSGLRAGETLGLQWCDIDFERLLLKVRRSAWYGKVQTPKSKNSEAILPLPEPLAAKLRAYRGQWKPNPGGFLFVTRNDRPPSSNNVVEHHLWPILDALKIERCGLHAFRHSMASHLLDMGVPLPVVQAQLRHGNARVTMQYGHVVGDSHRQAVEKMASILDPSGPKPKVVNEWIQ